MHAERLVAEHPVLFHMAEDGTWPSIRANGLLSAAALVDRFDAEPVVRQAALTRVRADGITLRHRELGVAVLRDQGPLRFTDRCLAPGTTLAQFLDALNSRVFFWPSRARLARLLGARRYREHPQTVLHVPTTALLARHGERVQLAHLNTGSMFLPNAPVRGVDVFVDLADYPYEHWRRKRGRADAVVELTVPHAVPDIAELVTRVERWVDGAPVEVLYERGAR